MSLELPIVGVREPPITVYVTIGNDVDSLSQGRWVAYHDEVVEMITLAGARILADWYSAPLALWQGHCFCVEVKVGVIDRLMEELAKIARAFGQPGIAWAEAPKTAYLG